MLISLPLQRFSRYRVQARFERHKREFDVYAANPSDAEYEANVLIRSIHSRSTGAYTRRVWQQGRITMTSEDGTIRELPSPPPVLTVLWPKRLVHEAKALHGSPVQNCLVVDEMELSVTEFQVLLRSEAGGVKCSIYVGLHLTQLLDWPDQQPVEVDVDVEHLLALVGPIGIKVHGDSHYYGRIRRLVEISVDLERSEAKARDLVGPAIA